ncbi:hypothetical protein [Butyrivibrio sp. TB]|uniref:hypothetical protein n=1 Tax=Butyrivibrio sp. TB TaxID=1520809 RepID=UPI0008CF79C2|nr:hypothetical protein [Butyrivibrio sp. TB]SEP90902.1 hypothetical protein SAMN02910382_01380 [Butyrivibrio sp. TB]
MKKVTLLKKYCLVGLAGIIAASAIGCTSEDINLDKDEVAEDVSSEESSQDEENEKVEDNNTGSTDNSSDSEDGKDESDANTESTEDADVSEDDTDIGANSRTAYKEFEDGTAKVKYVISDGDLFFNAEYNDPVFEEAEFYSMDEIIEACKELDYYNADGNPTITYTEIDCGDDCIPELYVDIQFGAASSLAMIIKEVDGELVLCYDELYGDRYMLEIGSDGTIEGSGSSAANIHSIKKAFIDADGNYIYYYGCTETLGLYNFSLYTSGVNEADFSTDGLDIDHIGVDQYYFSADYRNCDYFYHYFIFDDNYEDISTDADYEDSSEIKQAFSDAGVLPYTQDEIDEMLAERAEEVGYPGK